MATPPHHFDRGKPFYQLVVTYVSQLFGFKELAVRALAGGPAPDDVLARAVSAGELVAGDARQVAKLRADLMKLMGPLELHTEQLDDRIVIDPTELARELFENHSYLLPTYFQSAAGALLVTAHEVSKGKPWHDKSPILEFLYHCRNAAGHNWRFMLHPGQPKRPANWGKIEITAADNDKPLFVLPGNGGLLSPGDPIRLLWDIEQAYPQMTV